MNDYILYRMILDLLETLKNNYNKNNYLLRLEEYIEWSKLSIRRFSNNSKDYDKYMEKNLIFFQELQADILLDDIEKVKNQLTLYISKHQI